jgi:hypothetical protein
MKGNNAIKHFMVKVCVVLLASFMCLPPLLAQQKPVQVKANSKLLPTKSDKEKAKKETTSIKKETKDKPKQDNKKLTKTEKDKAKREKPTNTTSNKNENKNKVPEAKLSNTAKKTSPTNVAQKAASKIVANGNRLNKKELAQSSKVFDTIKSVTPQKLVVTDTLKNPNAIEYKIIDTTVSLQSDTQNIVQATAVPDTIFKVNIEGEQIMQAFVEEDYTTVIKLGRKYIDKNKTDTNILLKYGLAKIFSNQEQSGFEIIDKTIVQKDSLLKFYCVLPFINNSAKEPIVINALAQHCKAIDKNSVYTQYLQAVYWYKLDSSNKALPFAYKVHQQAKQNRELQVFLSLYPQLLHHAGYTDSAIVEYEQLMASNNAGDNIRQSIYYLYKQKNNYNKAAQVAKEMYQQEPNNLDYAEQLIDALILANSNNEACTIIDEVGAASDDLNTFALKKLLAQCPNYIGKIPFTNNSIYTWQVNDKGKFMVFTCNINASFEDSIVVNYNSTGERVKQGKFTISKLLFDTCINVNAQFYDSIKVNANDGNVLSLWLSRLAMQGILQNGTINLGIDGEQLLFEVVPHTLELPDYNAMTQIITINQVNNKLVNTIHLVNQDRNYHIWVNNDVKNPLIVKIETDISCRLIEVK